jgi:hypothetical protein
MPSTGINSSRSRSVLETSGDGTDPAVATAAGSGLPAAGGDATATATGALTCDSSRHVNPNIVNAPSAKLKPTVRTERRRRSTRRRSNRLT